MATQIVKLATLIPVSITSVAFVVLAGFVLLSAIAVISLWIHKKSGTGKIQLIGAEAVVHSELNPEGSVLIDGELWRARSLDGTNIAAQSRVEVTAVAGHLLLVKRYA